MSSRTDPEYMSQAAHHEAAHAVALMVLARELGFRCDVILGMKLDTDGKGELIDFHGNIVKNCRALVTVRKGWMDELKVYFDTKEDRRRACRFAEAHIVALLAGPTAQLVFTDAPYKCVYSTNPQGCEGDLRKVYTLNRSRRTLGVRYKSWRSLYDAALPLVQEHWQIIQALAALLVQHGELDGLTVEAFVASLLPVHDQRLAA